MKFQGSDTLFSGMNAKVPRNDKNYINFLRSL